LARPESRFYFRVNPLSAAGAGHPQTAAFHRKAMAAGLRVFDTECNEAANKPVQPLRCSPLKEPIMRSPSFTQFLIGAALFAAVSAQAAEQKTEQLERVIVSGKAVKTEIAQLPRVVVSGLSVNSQMQQLLLASAKPSVRRI
jgi:hypothetical protein